MTRVVETQNTRHFDVLTLVVRRPELELVDVSQARQKLDGRVVLRHVLDDGEIAAVTEVIFG